MEGPRRRGELPESVPNRACYASESPSSGVSESTPTSPPEGAPLTTSGYRITVDEGRDSFYALCIEAPDHDEMWLMSDTVRTLQDAQ